MVKLEIGVMKVTDLPYVNWKIVFSEHWNVFFFILLPYNVITIFIKTN